MMARYRNFMVWLSAVGLLAACADDGPDRPFAATAAQDAVEVQILSGGDVGHDDEGHGDVVVEESHGDDVVEEGHDDELADGYQADDGHEDATVDEHADEVADNGHEAAAADEHEEEASEEHADDGHEDEAMDEHENEVAREMNGEQLILPIWHNITKDQLLKVSPSLTDRIALSTGVLSLHEIADELADAVRQVYDQ